jgi:putative peptide zinc metalloprotease protein
MEIPGRRGPGTVRGARDGAVRQDAALVAIAMLLLVDAAMAFLALDGGAPRMYAASWLSATAITLFGTLLHELGHVSACAKFGARHDGIGVGLYWLWPTFYSEVHDAWRLPKLQRAVVDAGGIYFQGIYAVLLGLAALATGEPTLWLACWFSHYLMLHTLNPVLKFDGYWLLSDLSGSYNLHARIKQIWGRVFRAVARRGGEWPGRWEMALLLGFTAFAAVYFWFVANFLCANIVSLSLELWDWGWGTGPAGSALTGWGVAGKTLGLGLMLMFAWGLARGIGRSLHAVARQ